MDVAKKFLNISIVLLAVIFFFINILYVYIRFIAEQKTQITGAFIGQQVDPNSGKEYPLLEINYYSNRNEKGKEVIEIRLNGFSEADYQTVYSRGFQLVDGEIYPYDSHNDSSWVSAEAWSTEDILPIYIGEKKYGLKLEGEYISIVEKPSAGKIALGIIGGVLTCGVSTLITALAGGTYTNEVEETISYTFKDFINYCKTLAISHSNGYGDTVIPAIDLGTFFKIYKLNNGSYESIVPYEATNQNMYYFSAKVHCDYKGMTLSKQSMFDSVAGESDFNITGQEEVEYWQTMVNYNLTEECLTKRYSQALNGYLLDINEEVLKEIKNYECNIICDLNIDLDSVFMKDIVGIDYFGFSDLNFNNINIRSLKERDFTICTGGLDGSKIRNFIKSPYINLISQDGTNYGGDSI